MPCRYMSCESLCATTASRLRTSMAGDRMRRPVGIITGAMIGNSTEAAGTNGIAALPRPLPRCPPTSGSIQGIGIRNKWSSSMSFNNSVTVISRAIQSCGNTIRSAIRNGQCKHRRGRIDRVHLKKEVSGSRISSALRHAGRRAQAPRARSRRKGEVKTFRGQPPPRHKGAA